MNFIDWSDSEGMFGLLLDFIAGERAHCREDPERHRFLSELLTQLNELETQVPEISASTLIEGLRVAHDSVDREFAGDPVLSHLRDCIEELEKVEDGR